MPAPLRPPPSRSARRTQCLIDCAVASNPRASSSGVRRERIHPVIWRRNSDAQGTP